MAITWDSLADGQLPNTKGTLYTVPASTKVAVTAIILVANDGVARTVNVYVKRSGSTSRRIIPKDTALGAAAMINACDDPQSQRLSDGDIIEGDADTAAKVDYLICGAVLT